MQISIHEHQYLLNREKKDFDVSDILSVERTLDFRM